MHRTFPLHPEGRLYTITGLEAAIGFTYCAQIRFETAVEEKEIRKKTLAQWKKKEISQEAIELGKKFHQHIVSGYIPAVSIHYLGKKIGYGLFAEETISKNSYVGEYTGVVRKNDRRYIEPLNNYCYQYPLLDQVGIHFIIDATEGNLTRFINHSTLPNLKPVYLFWQGLYHLIFLSTEVITKGTQLSYDYGKNYWYIREPPTDLLSPLPCSEPPKLER